MSLEIKSNELINHLQIASSYKESFKSYLGDVFEDIATKSSKRKGVKTLDIIAFHDFLNFPMLISEKIFNAFLTSNAIELDKEIFIEGMQALFCVSSVDSFTKLLFRMFDFKVRGLAMIYNIKLLLTQLHLRTSINSDTGSLLEIINKCLGEDHSVSLTFSFFIGKLAENADVLYLFLAYVYKYFNKQKDCIAYYAKVICRAKKNDGDCNNNINSNTTANNEENTVTRYKYATPSKKLLKYLKDELGIDHSSIALLSSTGGISSSLSAAGTGTGTDMEQIDTSLDDLSQLDDFESEMESCMIRNCIESPYKSPTQLKFSSEWKYKSMNPIPPFALSNNNNNNGTKPQVLKHYSSNVIVNSTSLNLTNVNSNSSNSNNNSVIMNAWTVKPKHNQIKEFICKYYQHGSNDPMIMKIIFVGNNLFKFNYVDQSHCYIYDGLHFLRKNYIEKSQGIINEQFKITITSDYGGYSKSNQLYFDDKFQYEFFYEEFIQAICYRSLKEDIIILQEINGGNCGTIFTGFSNRLNKKVCIKKICKKDKERPEVKLIRWEQDVTYFLIKALHKNVMQAYDIYEDAINVYLILEYVEGIPLAIYNIKNENDKVNIMKQIIEALQFLHKNSIVHRDIKHDNVMIRQYGPCSVKLVDFGFARVLSKFDIAKEFCGSISFTAPEILLNHPYGCTIDVWSLGVLLFWINYKELPFRSQTNDTKKVAGKIIKGALTDPLNGCFADKLILLCLKTEPKERCSLRSLLGFFMSSQ